MDIQKMADELNLERVFFFLICDPRKDLALKREPQQKILDKFLPVVDIRCYGICDGANIRDAAVLRERIKALFPVQAEIILIQPEKDLVSLLMPEQRDRFIEKLMTFDGDTAELAAAILAGDEEEPELFEQIRTGQDSVLQLKCYPAPEDLPRRQDYFTTARQRFAQEGKTYSEDAAFQDELCRTLNLVFRADFGELWSGITAGA